MSAAAPRQSLGQVGIWTLELRFGDAGQITEAAAELDELGFSAIWIPGGIGGDVAGDVNRLLAATKRATIATGIINIWKHEAADIAAWWKGLPADHQARLLLGLGVSHSPLIGDAYQKPLTVMRNYLDGLAAGGVPADSLCIAALRQKMLELSRDRTAGAHPYLVTPEHSAYARKILGPGKLLAPEQGVILESDPTRARELARQALTQYQQLPNYRNSWLNLGFSEDDVANASDRLVDGLFAWGTPDKIRERVKAHIDAGADHVCLQVITGSGLDLTPVRAAWRELAGAFL
jgi:probable F420-dependent oxidoreductase